MVQNIRIVHYNNKSRKGLYIGLKTKGRREQVLKYDPSIPLDLYVQHHTRKQHWTKLRDNIKDWKGDTKKQEMYVKKLRKKGRLSTQFKKGHIAYRTNLQALGTKREQEKIYKRLLGGLILDKKLLPIVLANKTKLRRWFAHTLDVYTRQDGKTVKTVRYTDAGKRLPEEIYNTWYRQLNYRKGTVLTREKVDQDVRLSKVSKLGTTITSELRYDSRNTINRVMVQITYQVG